jgi:site-specific DNA-methyltransferase (adenine-specific)
VGAQDVIPFYKHAGITIYHGDGMSVAAELLGTDVVDVVIADPPYGETSLPWDSWPRGWPGIMPGNSLWCFGSLRTFVDHRQDFGGWQLSQDVVWEKQNGSMFHADRFRRVHELATHWYKGQWAHVYKSPVLSDEETPPATRHKLRPPHAGDTKRIRYTSVDGGRTLRKSVMRVRSEHGRALHPTQKPLGIVLPLLEYSCPADGLVFDPFMGSGTTLRAAKDTGRRAIGVDVDEKWCEIAARRLDQEAFAV